MTKQTIISRLLEAREGFKDIQKRAENPYYKSKYADLNEIISAIETAMAEQGIIVVQYVEENALHTVLYDVDGHELRCGAIPLLAASDMQKLGSAITYARRYALQAALLLRAEDDDGNAAVNDKLRTMPAKIAGYFAKHNYSTAQIDKKCAEYAYIWDDIDAAIERAGGYNDK